MKPLRQTAGITLSEILCVTGFCAFLLSGFLPTLKQSVDLSQPIQQTADEIQFLATLETAFRQADPTSAQLTTNTLTFAIPPAADPLHFILPPNTRAELQTEPNTTNTPSCATFTLFRATSGTQLARLLTCD